MKRIFFTKTLVAIFVILIMSVLSNQGLCQETLYLSDSGPSDDGKSKLFSVSLDTTTMHANLTLLEEIGYNQVDALAATPDGSFLYAIDKYCTNSAFCGDGWMGRYEVGTDTFSNIAQVEYYGTNTPVPQIVLAAFSPIDGKLYAASDATDSLYTIDTGTAEATLVGQIRKDGTALVNVSGADLVFAADGTFYLWANSAGAAPKGLYTLTLPTTTPGTVVATHIGVGAAMSFTGLAIRENGFGDLVGSATTPGDSIWVINKTDATSGDEYPMYANGSSYPYSYGDMTVGSLIRCTKTIGYWKNHDWPSCVTICGDEICDDTILWDARGNNFSMFFAQLIAAKLNTNNLTGIAGIGDAEAWLCSHSQGVANYDDPFASKKQKREAAGYWSDLDYFNNQYECE